MAKKERITLDALYKDVANLDIKNIQIEVERDGPNLILPPGTASWFKPDTTGRLRAVVNTSGYVTEANSAGIKGGTDYLGGLAYSTQHPMFTTSPGVSASVMALQKPKRFQTTVTATAGGEIVAVAVGPPALASYQCCMVITHIWSDQTDASIALTWSSTGGLAEGLAATTIATTANTVTPDWNQGLAWKATADNDTIDVACAAGQAGNAQNITFCGYYWYET